MATPGTLTITDQSDRIHLDGEIDLATSSQLVDHLEAACQPGVDLLIDMTEVTFIDSTGLGALIHIAKQCRASHGEVRITNWPRCSGRCSRSPASARSSDSTRRSRS